MKTVAGVWIDHRKAVIVTISENSEETKQVLSHVDKQRSRVDGVQLNEKFDAGQVTADDSQQRDFTGHLNVYYKDVLEVIKNADSVFIIGPGEAKGEMKKFMDKNGHSAQVSAVEASDKMTDRQVSEKVREFFGGKGAKFVSN